MWQKEPTLCRPQSNRPHWETFFMFLKYWENVDSKQRKLLFYFACQWRKLGWNKSTSQWSTAHINVTSTQVRSFVASCSENTVFMPPNKGHSIFFFACFTAVNAVYSLSGENWDVRFDMWHTVCVNWAKKDGLHARLRPVIHAKESLLSSHERLSLWCYPQQHLTQVVSTVEVELWHSQKNYITSANCW